MLGFLLYLHTAVATPPYLAVPVEGVEGLSEPHFQSVATGWTALVAGGFVAVYTGKSNAEALAWVESKIEAMKVYAPEENPDFRNATGVDGAWGDGTGLLIFHQKNMAAMCRHTAAAERWAQAIQRSAVTVNEAWPNPPELQTEDGGWTPTPDPNRVHLQFVGGTTKVSPKLYFSEKPEKLIGWDQWGRASVALSHNDATSP